MTRSARLHADGLTRCPWPGEDPFYMAYHDTEWGVPEYDDRALYEKLILDGFQAGLSWITILRKRDNFRRAFDDFQPDRIAGYNDKTEDEWLRELTKQTIDDYETFRARGLARLPAPDDAVAFAREIREPERHPFSTPSGKIEIYSMAIAARPDTIGARIENGKRDAVMLPKRHVLARRAPYTAAGVRARRPADRDLHGRRTPAPATGTASPRARSSGAARRWSQRALEQRLQHRRVAVGAVERGRARAEEERAVGGVQQDRHQVGAAQLPQDPGGAVELAEPVPAMFWFRDPDGNELCVIEPGNGFLAETLIARSDALS